ncbi:hypothetical protein [uncultured Eudoraea sp.]|uniref:hypothetical protein n=1 Tax=uncultured Eudoraea sp. TaxID=1035614 RepID=UPI0026385A5E|nr:hypothetical protein [uncultured Eudoraea sp.]
MLLDVEGLEVDERLIEFSKGLYSTKKLFNMAYVLNGTGKGKKQGYNYDYGYGAQE